MISYVAHICLFGAHICLFGAIWAARDERLVVVNLPAMKLPMLKLGKWEAGIWGLGAEEGLGFRV